MPDRCSSELCVGTPAPSQLSEHSHAVQVVVVGGARRCNGDNGEKPLSLIKMTK